MGPLHTGRRLLPRRLLPMTACVLACAPILTAQAAQMGPPHDSGQSVTAAFEGWFPNPDGTFSILFGYLNRNAREELDIPIGAGNKIEPGGPDRGQPTHFLTGRNWGIFTVTVPGDFGSGKIVWSLTANGASTQVPAGLDPLWELAPFRDANGNTPPWIGFEETGPFVNGPRGSRKSLTATAGKPVSLPVWVADDAAVIPGATRPRTPPVTVAWSKFRGPGSVTFSNDRPPADAAEFSAPPQTVFHGKALTSAAFSEPGEYVLRVVANDWSGDGGRGFQCCWSNAQVVVSVK
jgi:hypothetical protein